jgi:hypothetical protein
MEEILIKCQQNLNLLCNVCGLFTPKTKRKSISNLAAEKYYEHFHQNIVKDTDYAPKIICINCYTMLNESRHRRNVFQSPMVWAIPDGSHSNCYACLILNLKHFSWQNRKTVKYPEYPETNSRRPIWTSPNTEEASLYHEENEPQPSQLVIPSSSQGGKTPKRSLAYLQPTTSESSEENTSKKPNRLLAELPSTSSSLSSIGYIPSETIKKVPEVMGQASFNDFVRDMGIPQSKIELAGSRFREKNWLTSSTRTTFLRNDKSFISKFKNVEINMVVTKTEKSKEGKTHTIEETVSNTLTYCDNLEGLFELFEVQHKATEWRLFLDGSTESLKVVLLHNGNEYPSVPLAYSRHCPEKYDSMKLILEHIKYNKYEWDVIVDFKLINILEGLMAAASKNPCIHCLWDSKYNGKDKYWKTDWPPRPNWSKKTAGTNNAIKPPLIPRCKILFPPLHIKIGLVKQLFKKIYETNEKAGSRLCKIFPRLSKQKIEAGVFDGPQIRQIFKDSGLPTVLSEDQSHALSCLIKVCENFLGNNRAPDYSKLVKEMALSYDKLGINVTIKIHSLLCHLDLFKENCGAFSDEQGERFHQDLKKTEENYKGKDMANGLGRYCFGLIREKDTSKHKRKSTYNKKTQYFYVNKEN